MLLERTDEGEKFVYEWTRNVRKARYCKTRNDSHLNRARFLSASIFLDFARHMCLLTLPGKGGSTTSQGDTRIVGWEGASA